MEYNFQSIRRRAINLWLEQKSDRDARVRTLLDKDESAITIDRVNNQLHKRR